MEFMWNFVRSSPSSWIGACAELAQNSVSINTLRLELTCTSAEEFPRNALLFDRLNGVGLQTDFAVVVELPV